MKTKAPVLVLPGYGNSGPAHWQSRWEAGDASFRRVAQRDWDRPVCDEWVEVLDRAVRASGPDVVLVAHSLACLVVAAWAGCSPRSVRGALLVAPPDPAGPGFPTVIQGFGAFVPRPLGFSSVLVASSDDPYAELAFARRCAGGWGSHLVEVGPRGHINGESGLGNWPEGWALLERLRTGERNAPD